MVEVNREGGYCITQEYNVPLLPKEDTYVVTCREYHLYLEKLNRLSRQKSGAAEIFAIGWSLLGIMLTCATFGVAMWYTPAASSWAVFAAAAAGGALIGMAVCFWVAPQARKNHAERIDEIVESMQEVVRRQHRTRPAAAPGHTENDVK